MLTLQLRHKLKDKMKWIQRMGIAGHSGDVSAHQPGQLRYAIEKLPWRSPALTKFLRALDLLHLETRFTPTGRPRQGAFPRYRVPQGKRVDYAAEPVPGLPRNFYDSKWLAIQDEAYLKDLDIKQSSVDLTLPPSLEVYVSPRSFSESLCYFLALLISLHLHRQIARYKHVTGPDTPPLPRRVEAGRPVKESTKPAGRQPRPSSRK